LRRKKGFSSNKKGKLIANGWDKVKNYPFRWF
jgi:hypothetical protein